MDDVIGQGREAMAATVQERLQVYLNVYGTGMSVRSVNLDRGRHRGKWKQLLMTYKGPEDEERFINEANAYAEQVVPEARGDAQRIIEQANAYRDEVVLGPKGRPPDLLRFWANTARLRM